MNAHLKRSLQFLERSPRVERVFAEMKLLSYALQKVSQEFKEMQAESDRGRREFHVIVYVAPITTAERNKIIAVWKRMYGKARGVPEDEWLEVAVPRGAGCFGIRAQAAGADGAAALCLVYTRRVLQEIGISAESLRLEVEE